MLHVYVDADACPVKDEIHRVARRYALSVTFVANTWVRIPDDPRLVLEVVREGSDVADDWIVEHLEPGDIVITADIPLARRCLRQGALVLGPSGRAFTEDGIGQAVATRDLLSELRSAGQTTGGPAPLRPRDRSTFLQTLDQLVQSTRRSHGR